MSVKNFTFPPQARLRKPGEFKFVLSGGRRLQEPPLTAVSKSNEVQRPRLGFAVSARSVPRAVDRNRIKRQARESFCLRRAQLPALDIVILARTGAGKTPARELRAVLDRLWKKLCDISPKSPGKS
ncbi:MAG: ribonuclease P protein component [Hydrocarboniphaga effusa]|nr:ribonuclease P protein component [Hydrocarboniphaga effusa]